jgi:Family of unknown function (DUF6125)
MLAIENLTREQLIELVKNYSKNWLAHDGLWFQAVERAHGIEHAIEMDAEAWSYFSPIEAKRILGFCNLPPNGGLEALQQALEYRMYAVLNKQSSTLENGVLRFFMNDCRVQSARKRRGLDDFPCKEVGLVEYQKFAETIDSRIKTRCIACPPDDHPDDYFCGWEFWIDEVAP